MVKAIAVLFCLLALSVVYGCGSGSGSASGTTAPTGSVALQVDLSKLSSTPARTLALTQVNPAAITEVKATLSGDNFGPATYDLTVSGNTATGTITNLPSGNMHIVLNAYGGTTLLYTGSSDVNVVSGAVAKTRIILDPVNSGSVVIDVGVNPIPGYKIVSQNVGSATYHDSTGGKTYVLDYFARILRVWDDDMTTYLKDLALPSGADVLALSVDGKQFFVSCREGQIYKIDTVSGATQLLANVSSSVRGLEIIDGKYLLAATDLPCNMTRFRVIDIATGNITATTDYNYYIYEMVLNPANGVAYAQDVNVSPRNIHRIQVDRSSGAIVNIGSSSYAGVYGFDTPLRIIKNGAFLISASGHIFTSSADPTKDLIASGSITNYHDLAADDALNFLYLASMDQKKLIVLRSDDFGVVRAIDLPIAPLALYQTNTSIVVFCQNFGDPNYYAKSFKKSDLGLIGPQ